MPCYLAGRVSFAYQIDDLYFPLSAVTTAGGGRNAILARLGHEAADALDEFLNLALDYERIETPSLQGFVAWLREANSEVKRDMEITRDEVRVMTVHGAKGLQAPIVILPDTMRAPQSRAELLWTDASSNLMSIINWASD
mgnify:CR=1 FL=1